MCFLQQLIFTDLLFDCILKQPRCSPQTAKFSFNRGDLLCSTRLHGKPSAKKFQPQKTQKNQLKWKRHTHTQKNEAGLPLDEKF